MKKEKEIWREYPLNYNFVNEYKIEFSNLGRVRSYNSHNPDGKILKGTLQGGFPIIRITLFRKRTAKHVERIQEIQNKIDKLNEDVKHFNVGKLTLEKKAQLRKERDSLIKNRAKINAAFENRRKIYVAILVHKAVAELFLEKPEKEEQKFIIHKDFDKTNNSVDNLLWASQEELNVRYMMHPKNILHAFKKQFEPQKVKVRASKLSENDVLFIKKRIKKGDSLRKLAQRFSVSDMQIHRIKTGENWSHVKLIEDIKLEK